MFFIKAANVIAWLAVLFGALRVVTGLFIAIAVHDAGERMAMTSRYLGRGSTGEHIDQAIYVIVVGVGLGVLAQIGKSLAKPEE